MSKFSFFFIVAPAFLLFGGCADEPDTIVIQTTGGAGGGNNGGGNNGGGNNGGSTTYYGTTTGFDSILEIVNESYDWTTEICIANMGYEDWQCEAMSLEPGYYTQYGIYSGCYDILIFSGEYYGWDFSGECVNSGETMVLSLMP